MKKLLGILLVIASFNVCAFDIIGVDSVNVTATYTEPTTNEDGSTLTDLDHVTVFYDIGAGFIIGIEQPASSPTGGTLMTVLIPVPISAGQEANVSFKARAFDISGNGSADTNIAMVRIDRLAPSAPQ